MSAPTAVAMGLRPAPSPKRICLGGAVAVLAGAWLLAWADYGVTGHMVAHMAAVSVAAPLLAIGIAGSRFDPATRWPAVVAPLAMSLVELAVVWIWHLPAARALNFPGRMGLGEGEYAVSTLHRPSNVDDAGSLCVLVEGLARIAREMPVVLPLHPRTRRNLDRFGLGPAAASLRLLDPVGYSEMIGLTDGAAVVLTDSGGLQEETTALGVPCVTLREQTERPITLTEGTNRMAPWPLTVDGIVGSFREALALGRSDPAARRPEGWDGQASRRIVAALTATGRPAAMPIV